MSVSEYVKKLAKAKKAAKNSDNETVEKVHSMTDEEKAAALKKKKRTKENMNDAMKERKEKALEQENPKKEKPKTLSPGDFPPLKTSA